MQSPSPLPAEAGSPARPALFSAILGDLRSREEWLARQGVWHALRHDGLRRRAKPFPGAADLHYPLADTIIDKLKPFYFAQVTGADLVAHFVPRDPTLEPHAAEVAQWFDYKLRHESNLERELLVAIDKMLTAGHAPVKVYWDAARRRLAFDAVEPAGCLVPPWTTALPEADRVTLVHTMSLDQYGRDPRFTVRDPETLRRIAGRGAAAIAGEPGPLEALREAREGVTHASGPETLVVWEAWTREGEGWTVHWFSPLLPGTPLRPSQRNPFQHGRLPLVRFDAEVKDKGHYAARGIPEKAGPFEASLCKLWNEKHDFMTFCNRPLFTGEHPLPHAGNLRFLPGQYIPGKLQAVPLPAPPVSFDQEMTATRLVAEQNLGMPDFGTGQSINTTERRTATEVENIAGLHGQQMELRARIFRQGLGELLELAWDTLLQYDDDPFFFHAGQGRRLPRAALAGGAWRLQPGGSPEGWNRAAQRQRAVTRKQLLGESPWVDQQELDRSLVELDDPRLVRRLFRTPAATGTGTERGGAEERRE